jgi:hypothetical protein
MATIDDVRALEHEGKPAYEVGVAFELEDVTVYRVHSDELGLSVQVRDDDADTIQSLVDGHDERVAQKDETLAETHLRWAADPDHPFELDDDGRAALEEQVAAQRAA